MNKNDFIEFMLSCDVLKLGDFVTKSGRNTPYFINTGNYKTGKQIATLAKFYASLINETTLDFDAMFGPAYKGIPLATSAAAALFENYNIDKPYFFNRKEVKDHGEGGSLIGYKPKNGDNIIIIEDVITAGTAIRETVPILKAYADIQIKDMFISVNRCEVGNSDKTATDEVFDEFGITIHSIITVKDIYQYLLDKNKTETAYKMREYMEKYCK